MYLKSRPLTSWDSEANQLEYKYLVSLLDDAMFRITHDVLADYADIIQSVNHMFVNDTSMENASNIQEEYSRMSCSGDSCAGCGCAGCAGSARFDGSCDG